MRALCRLSLRAPFKLDRFRVFTPVECQTDLAEHLSTEFTPFGMRRAERCGTVVTESSRVAATGYAVRIVHTSHFDHSAE